MSSNLKRLFAYARATMTEAKENFTTEALAAAIRDDPNPFVESLRVAGVVTWKDAVIAVVPQTQVHLEGAGFIDLAVALATATERRDVWIEVKVDAGESGQQLDNYARFVETLPASARPTLAVLSPRPLRAHASYQWISWQSVWRAISPTTTTSPYWHDLKSFLEEISMADDSDFAVTALEALSLVAVPQLTAKAQRILWAFAADAAKQWPSYRWPKAESELRSDLQSQFRNHNRLTFYASSGSRAVPVVGVTRGSIEAMLSIWVESPPKRTDVRQRILTAADEGGLPPRWTRRLDTWQGLVIEQRLVSFATHDDAAAWLHRGFEELDRSGLLALMPTLGKATAEETGERVG